MRPATIAALALAFLLLAGCISTPMGDFPPKGAAGPVKDAKSLVEKSSIPLPDKNAPLPLPEKNPAQPDKEPPAATSPPERQAETPLPAQPAPPSPAPAAQAAPSNNSTTPVIAPSAESAPELETEISIANPRLPQVYFYYSSYCPYSIRILPFVQKQQSRFGNFSEWHSFDVYTQQGYYFFDRMASSRNFTNASRAVPLIIVGANPESGRMLQGINEINSTLAYLLWNVTREERLAHG